MSEILFRGKATNRIEGRAYRTSYKNGDWVYGLLTKVLNYLGFAEMTNTNGVSGIEVDPETVGQFTGFYDSTRWEELTPEEQQEFLHQPDFWENTPDTWPGKRIFEGDILEFADTGETGYEYKEGFDYTNRAAVVWGNGRWELERFLETNSGVNEDMIGRSYHEEFILVFGSSKIIGNVYDDPGLLLPWDGDDDDSPF